MGTVSYNFQDMGIIDFAGTNLEEVEEALILGEVDVQNVTCEDGEIEVQVTPSDLEKAKKVLNDMGITEFDTAENTMLANEEVELQGDDLKHFQAMLAELDESEDVQAVYHNVANA